jgi:hypothetical protein
MTFFFHLLLPQPRQAEKLLSVLDQMLRRLVPDTFFNFSGRCTVVSFNYECLIFIYFKSRSSYPLPPLIYFVPEVLPFHEIYRVVTLRQGLTMLPSLAIFLPPQC